MFSQAPRRLSILSLVLLTLPATASTRRHDRNDFDYLSASTLFTPVGRFTGSGTTADGQPLNYSASGTLIAPNGPATSPPATTSPSSTSPPPSPPSPPPPSTKAPANSVASEPT